MVVEVELELVVVEVELDVLLVELEVTGGVVDVEDEVEELVVLGELLELDVVVVGGAEVTAKYNATPATIIITITTVAITALETPCLLSNNIFARQTYSSYLKL